MTGGGTVMIVRIPSEGQWEVHGEAVDELDRCDRELAEALREDDAASFAAALAELVRCVRDRGRRLAPEELVESTLILPAADTTIEELRPLFLNDGVLVS